MKGIIIKCTYYSVIVGNGSSPGHPTYCFTTSTRHSNTKPLTDDDHTCTDDVVRYRLLASVIHMASERTTPFIVIAVLYRIRSIAIDCVTWTADRNETISIVSIVGAHTRMDWYINNIHLLLLLLISIRYSRFIFAVFKQKSVRIIYFVPVVLLDTHTHTPHTATGHTHRTDWTATQHSVCTAQTYCWPRFTQHAYVVWLHPHSSCAYKIYSVLHASRLCPTSFYCCSPLLVPMTKKYVTYDILLLIFLFFYVFWSVCFVVRLKWLLSCFSHVCVCVCV